MSRLATLIAAENVVTKGPRCSVGTALKDLPPADREDLAAALAEPAVTHVAIFRALKAVGLRIAATSVSRHRRGDCGCAR